MKQRWIEAKLLKRGGENLTVLQTIGAAQKAPLVRQPISKSEVRSEVMAVAAVGDLGQAVDFGRPSHRLIAEAIVDCEIRTGVPLITGEDLRFPVTEPAARIADPGRESAGDAHAKVGDGISAEVVPEVNHAALAAGFIAIDLPPPEFAADAPGMPATSLLYAAGVMKTVLHAIDGNVRARPKWIEHRAERNRRPDGVGFGHDERVQAIETSRKVRHRGCAPASIPSEPRRVSPRSGVRILTGDQLERVHHLRCEQIGR